MTSWKLTIKPDNEEGFDPFKLCMDKSILGVGWADAYADKQATNIAEAKERVNAVYQKWPYPIKYLLEDVEEGNHIWLHNNGNYYLCKAGREVILGEAIDKDFIRFDIGHARTAEWIAVPEIYVSGTIQRGTIAQRVIQRINTTVQEFNYHEILFENLSKNPLWKPDIDISKLESAIDTISADDLFALLTSDDVEDVVSAYLQSKGWVLIKSTCFRSKPVFEFTMLNKSGETCHVQVKSGKYPNPLPPSEYSQYASPDKYIYLFSTNKNPYPGSNEAGIVPIPHNKLICWIKSNSWSLTAPLKYRLWIFLCEKMG